MLDLFNRLYDAIAALLAWLYSLPGVGYGSAVILLTLVVMLVMVPLTLSSTRSTLKMQQFQPELKRIQKEHADDREELNRQMMELYKEHGINPVGGCLPMFAQLPVFLVLFQVIRGVTRRVDEEAFFTVTNAVRPALGLEPLNGAQFEPRYVSPDSQLYQDLSAESSMNFGPWDLANEARDVFFDDFVGFLPYLALILFVVASSYYQQRQIMARRGSSAAAANPQQQAIMRVLPLVTGVTSFIFPSALVIYFAVSGLFRIAQQTYITRRLYGPDGEGTRANDAAAKAAAKAEAKKGEKSLKSPADDGSPGSEVTDSGSKPKQSKAQPKKRSESPTDAVSDDPPKSTSDREAAWAQRRKEKQKKSQERKSAQAKKSPSGGRVTPKGSQAQPKKRKR